MANKIIFITFLVWVVAVDASYSQVKVGGDKSPSIKSICCDFGGGTPLNEAIDVIMLEKFLITDTAKFRSLINIGNVFKKIKIYNADQTKSRLGVICKKGLLKLDLKEEYYMDFQTLQPILKSKI